MDWWKFGKMDHFPSKRLDMWNYSVSTTAENYKRTVANDPKFATYGLKYVVLKTHTGMYHELKQDFHN